MKEERRYQCASADTHLTDSDLTLKVTAVARVMMMIFINVKRIHSKRKILYYLSDPSCTTSELIPEVYAV